MAEEVRDHQRFGRGEKLLCQGVDIENGSRPEFNERIRRDHGGFCKTRAGCQESANQGNYEKRRESSHDILLQLLWVSKEYTL
jgi:hypothetical protein